MPCLQLESRSGSASRGRNSGVDGSGACANSVQGHCDMRADVAGSTKDVVVTMLVYQNMIGSLRKVSKGPDCESEWESPDEQGSTVRAAQASASQSKYPCIPILPGPFPGPYSGPFPDYDHSQSLCTYQTHRCLTCLSHSLRRLYHSLHTADGTGHTQVVGH